MIVPLPGPPRPPSLPRSAVNSSPLLAFFKPTDQKRRKIPNEPKHTRRGQASWPATMRL